MTVVTLAAVTLVIVIAATDEMFSGQLFAFHGSTTQKKGFLNVKIIVVIIDLVGFVHQS